MHIFILAVIWFASGPPTDQVFPGKPVVI